MINAKFELVSGDIINENVWDLCADFIVPSIQNGEIIYSVKDIKFCLHSSNAMPFLKYNIKFIEFYIDKTKFKCDLSDCDISSVNCTGGIYTFKYKIRLRLL